MVVIAIGQEGVDKGNTRDKVRQGQEKARGIDKETRGQEEEARIDEVYCTREEWVFMLRCEEGEVL